MTLLRLRLPRRALISLAAVTTALLVAALIQLTIGPGWAAETLLSQGKPATASSVEDSTLGPEKAVDGSNSTRWASAEGIDPQWIRVDLGSVAAITRVRLNWEAAYASAYRVEFSTDGSTWSTVYSTTTGTAGVRDITAAGSARHVRVYGTTRGTVWGYSLFEFQVYGEGSTPPSPTPSPTPTGTTLLSQGKPAAASSVEDSTFGPEKAFDGNMSTRWASMEGVDPQWIRVDLGTNATISRVKLTWEAAYGKAYRIETSSDTVNWTSIYSTTTGNGATDDLTGLSGSGRYVRVFGTVRGTAWGYSLFEVEVYGIAGGPPGDTQPPSVPTNLQATAVTSSSVSLGWSASTDNVGVTGYDVFRDGAAGPTVSGTTATITGLAASTSYRFKVRARDAAGNLSGFSTEITVSTTGGPGGTTPVAINGQLRVCGTNLCNQYNQPIQLRGMSTHGIQWYAQCVNASSLDALANDWKADVLRISMYIQEGGYETNPRAFTDMVHNYIEMATARGMYAIVDWHMLDPGDPNYNLARARTFFTEIAQRHAGKVNVLYEIANEPNGVSWSSVKSYAEQIIPVIRAQDPESVILVGTRAWSSLGVSDGSSETEVINNQVNATNIMYTFHFYAASHNATYLNTLSRAANSIPMFVTEFGTQNSAGEGANNFTMSQQYLDLMAQKKISWVNWNYSDDNRSGAVFNTGTCPGGPFAGTGSLKQAGVWIRDRIRTPDNFPTS